METRALNVGLTSFQRTRGDRRPRQAITGSPPPGLQPVMAAPYSNDRGSRMELARRESRWVSERLAFYRDMALSSHGTPLKLDARASCGIYPPGLAARGPRFFAGGVSLLKGAPHQNSNMDHWALRA